MFKSNHPTEETKPADAKTTADKPVEPPKTVTPPPPAPKPPAPPLKLSAPRLPRPQFKLPGSKWLKRGGAVLLVLLVMIGCGFAGAWLENRRLESQLLGPDLSHQRRVVTSESRLINQIARNVGNSVVSINVAIADPNAPSSFGLFGFTPPTEFQAAGTGIIISDDGVIVTNRHVVPVGTTRVSVTLKNGTELKDVSVLGRTNAGDNLDVAFLKINDAKDQKLQPASLGDSSKIQVGDLAVAIGNALGQFQNTVTSGIISGYGRSVLTGDESGLNVESLENLIQTDAAINQGNSGGPLVNLNGEVIGINTAVAGGGAENIGFAIPINDVRGLINQVIKTGKFARPYLGIRYLTLTTDLANQYNLSVTNGAFIAPSDDQFNSSVLPGGPADKAGLKEGDVITAVNDKKIDQSHSLTSLVGAFEPGQKVTLTVVRDDETLKLDATLGSQPTEQE